MQINVKVQGESNTQWYNKTFQYKENEEKIFEESFKVIKKRILSNMPININETLLFLAWHLVLYLREKKPNNQIEKELQGILSYNQVMIGVPEILNNVEFEVDLNGTRKLVSLERPIPIPKRVNPQ